MRTHSLLSLIAGVACVAIVMSMPMSLLAHHSHAMFDDAREVTITGTVAAIRFSNPHVYLLVEVAEDNGEVSQWAIEMSTVRNMINRGVSANTFHVEDEVVIRVNPLRSGQAGGNYTHIVSINGVSNTTSDNSWAGTS